MCILFLPVPQLLVESLFRDFWYKREKENIPLLRSFEAIIIIKK